MLEQIDHVNIVVERLDRMVEFYTRALGMNLTKRARISGQWIGDVVGLTDVDAEVVYLDLPQGPRIELIQYLRPAHSPVPRNDPANAPGLRHLAFRVRDIDRAAAQLTQAGVRFFSKVQLVPDAQVQYSGGVRKRLVYFQDPEGNLLELCEYKAGT